MNVRVLLANLITATIATSVVLPSQAGQSFSNRQQALIQSAVQHPETSGLIVAKVTEGQISYASHGVVAKNHQQAPDRSTWYEIGSITKVFTHLLLAEAVEEGKVQYSQRLNQFIELRDDSNLAIGEITLAELATHTSGLPRLPSNLAPKNPADPYAGYSSEMLIAAVQQSRQGQQLYKGHAYSNFAPSILAYILEQVYKKPYSTLLQEKILVPFGLNNTHFELSAAQQKQAAQPYSGKQETAYWHLDRFNAAGGLLSTAENMARFIQANINTSAYPLQRVQRKVLASRGQISPHSEYSLAWFIEPTEKNGPIYWHSGGTGGFRSFVGFQPQTGDGYVILSNNTSDISALGFQLFNHQRSTDSTAAAVDKSLAGHYEIMPGLNIEITASENQLYLISADGSRLTLNQVEGDTYSVAEADVGLTVQRNKDLVTGLSINQEGNLVPARRLTEAPKKKTYQAIALEPEKLDDYIGEYQLAPGVVFSIKTEPGQLMVQLSGQPFFPVFPYAEDQFFYQVVDAQLSFERSADGQIEALILHQNGLNQRAVKQ